MFEIQTIKKIILKKKFQGAESPKSIMSALAVIVHSK